MDSKLLWKGPLPCSSTQGATVDDFVLIPWLFFKALSHVYSYVNNISFCMFLNFFVFLCDFFLLFNINICFTHIKISYLCFNLFFFPQSCQRYICLISIFKGMFVFVNYYNFIFFFIIFSSYHLHSFLFIVILCQTY